MEKKEGFSSIMGFILVAIGLALGIGSLWRFPYVVGENGGAIFIIMYVAIILIIGIPLMTCEITIGFASQKTAIKAYESLAPGKKWYYAGYLHLLAAILILGYTAPIYAWIFKYVVASFGGSLMNLSTDEIVNFFESFNADKNAVFIYFVINILLNVVVIVFGVQKGIERISKILLPVLFAIMAIIIVSSLKLQGAMEGVRFLFLPDPSKFTMDSLLTCLGQAFFALGLAMLGSMVFGSYIKNKDEDIFKSASVVCIALIFAGIAAGLMIMPIVFATKLEAAEGVALSFLTLPNAFNIIPAGRILSPLFYLGFYIAAFTSSVGVLEAIVGLLSEEYKISRIKAVLIAVAFILFIAFFSIRNNALFKLLDKIESNFVLVIGCLLIAIFCGYVWGIENTMNAANIKNPLIRKWMVLSIKYISPIAIVVIFITQLL
ncbi:sodium-dependent transporter [Peptoniphilus catoniae]|uniref:sodium-dependent transporter n=1 Tax=Peptoniphilus catoniae TaxID=1660341 RepID=UPI0010FE39F7|nr:sodium-dependent transporter [Peptoniphilus catoniae]